MNIPPLVLNVLLCESVHRDWNRSKFYLLGVSNTLNFAEMPATLALSYLFLSFIEVNGPYNLRVEIVDVNVEHEPIFQMASRMEGFDPLKIFEFALPLIDVQFPWAGEYRLQLYIDNSLIEERKLTIRDKEGETHDG